MSARALLDLKRLGGRRAIPRARASSPTPDEVELQTEDGRAITTETSPDAIRTE